MTVAKWAFIFLVTLAASRTGVEQNEGMRTEAEDARATISGVWRGHSVCVDKNSPCHDEVNVYRFARVAGRANEFSVTASKVVDGKEIVMGSGEWNYDEKKKVVESEKPPIRLTIEGIKMEGTLSLADGTVYRRLHLEKES
ncbi:MAG TPA: hypothetical protein VIX91_21710 [Candidatus Acidoferrum sp.]